MLARKSGVASPVNLAKRKLAAIVENTEITGLQNEIDAKTARRDLWELEELSKTPEEKALA